MAMIGWLLRTWRRRQRQIDIDILWPICKREADTLDLAKVAFMFHCSLDPAWTRDFSEAEIASMVDELE